MLGPNMQRCKNKTTIKAALRYMQEIRNYVVVCN